MEVYVVAFVRGVEEKLVVASKQQHQGHLYFFPASKFPKVKVGDQIEIEEWLLELPRQSVCQLVLDGIV